MRALSQHIARPGPEHWSGMKHIFRHMKGTVNYDLKYVASHQKDIMLNGFSDADWAGDTSTRKSRSGYLFRLGKSTISSKSKRQSIVALSLTEAEYVALCSAAQETVWLCRLLSSIELKQSTPVVLFKDNQAV